MSRSTPRRKKQNNRQSKRPIDYLMSEPLKFFNQKYKNDTTRKAYIKNYQKYAVWCIENYNCKTNEQCKQYIQHYTDYLSMQGKSASTIHTMIAPVCGFHDVNMAEIDKPIRRVAETKRSRFRENKYDRVDQNYNSEKYRYVADFQRAVGIRRAELARLTYDCLKQDESGNWCIEVQRGKGGKYQLQRILPQDLDFIKSYFTTPGNSRMFTADQFSTHMDYHHLRALQSQRAYWYYYNLTHTGDKKSDEAAQNKLRQEIKARWNKYNINPKTGKPRYLNADYLLTGTYKLRGTNRELAVKNHLPTEYDKLSVMCVSIFHLSHWRLNTLCNYLLAI